MRILSHTLGDGLAMAVARTNLTLPEDLMAEVDELAGPRGRSRYVAEAVAQRVKRDKLGKAIRETAGIMVGSPGWMSPDEVVRWVDFLRSEETD
jgi:predicted transcriptional regulator